MKRIIAISAIMLSLSATGQEILTLQQCRDMAIQNNKEIKAAHQQTESAQYSAKSYKGLYYPNIKLNATGLYSTAKGSFDFDLSDMGGTIGTTAGQLIGTLHPEAIAMLLPMLGNITLPPVSIDYKVGPIAMAGISLEQPIYMGGKIKAANEMAKAGVIMAQTNDTLVKKNVIVDVDKAYALVVKANEMLKVAQSYNQVLKELMGNVQSAYKNGMKPKNDVMKVSVKLNESELNILKAENGRRLATMNLCHVIGLPLNSSVNVSSEFPSSDDMTVRNTSDITMRPEYTILDQQVKLAEKQVTVDKSSSRPEVGLVAMGNYIHGGEVCGQTLMDDFNGTFIVNVTIPLFHFGNNSNKSRASQAKLEMARYERENKNELMQLQLTQTANNLDEAKLEAKIADKNLEQAAENMRLSQKNYEAELEPLSDYLEAQTLWQQAYEQQVDAHFKLYLNYVEYKRAAGTL